MSTRVLRQIPRIDYYESEDPSYDQYVYCEKCVEYVFEYCAIHGPLLVILDFKGAKFFLSEQLFSCKRQVPHHWVTSTSNYSSLVPRAALTIPQVLHLAPSIIPGAGIGVFATITLPRGIRFGPYIGVRTNTVSSAYCWQVYRHNNKRSHVVDAADPQLSNWMRYINCSRHWSEQNLIAYQYKGHVYYRTIKTIPRFTELLVFYGSEYANSLQVNLSKYHDTLHYEQFISAPKSSIENLQNSKDSNMIRLQETVIRKEWDSDEPFTNFQVIDKSIVKIAECILERNVPDFTDNSHNANSDQGFKCMHCNKSFLKKKYLNAHLHIHSSTQKYQCTNCSYATSVKYSFKRHILIHSNQVFICEHCNKSFATERYLKRHLLSHLPIKKYQCSSCYYSTSIRHSWTRHVLVHSQNTVIGDSDKKFQHDYCNKLLSSKANIKCHPKYECSNCSYGTSVRNRFMRHVLIHSNQKFLCDHCNKLLGSKKSLKRHLLSHFPTNKYQCSNCSYSTSIRHYLKRHVQVHSKSNDQFKSNSDKIFQCDLCNKVFGRKYSLKRHLLSHFS